MLVLTIQASEKEDANEITLRGGIDRTIIILFRGIKKTYTYKQTFKFSVPKLQRTEKFSFLFNTLNQPLQFCFNFYLKVHNFTQISKR